MSAELCDSDFRYLLDSLDRPWVGYRKVRKGVMKRLRRHMNSLGIRSVKKYLQVILDNPEEMEICLQCLLVTISRFFRDRQLWQDLHKYHLPSLLTSFPEGLRFWSAGCASGEEPYSIAIVLDQLRAAVHTEIIATDINPHNLDRARIGEYPESSLRELSDSCRAGYFDLDEVSQQYRIKEKLKTISWQQHDLFAPPIKGPFQIIFLRNSLLTYHTGCSLETQLRQIFSTLSPGGYLITGSHEKIPHALSDQHLILSSPCIYKQDT